MARRRAATPRMGPDRPRIAPVLTSFELRYVGILTE